MDSLTILMPEIVLLSMASFSLIVDLFLPARYRFITYLLSQLALVATAACCWSLPADQTTSVFNDQFVLDPFSRLLKLFILALMFFILLYSRHYVRHRQIAFGEFHALALFSTLGMMLLVSAKSLLMVYLGLELLSLPLYAMVALQTESSSAVEAGMKYFVMGSLASGMLLYGISLLYGLTGSIQLDAIATYVQMTAGNGLQLSLFALGFIIVGLAFKLGAVPFHMWIPDIYQGAPTNITLLVGSAPKVAAFGMVYRLLHDALPSMGPQWGQAFMVIAILSLAIGNIVAIAQTNVKRLLAYSTIAHVGFLFLALLVAPQAGYASALYYILAYALVAVAGFGVLLLLSQQGFEAENLADLKGLGQRSPWLAFIMLLVAFSLAGVPPTIGFYAKFMVLSALVDMNLTWLAAFAVVFSIIGAYYYLKIVRVMYFDKPEVPFAMSGALDARIALSLNGLAVLGLGLFPAPFFMLCQRALGL